MYHSNLTQQSSLASIDQAGIHLGLAPQRYALARQQHLQQRLAWAEQERHNTVAATWLGMRQWVGTVLLASVQAVANKLHARSNAADASPLFVSQ